MVNSTVLVEHSLVQVRDKNGRHGGVGFVIAPGLVATNAHVAADADAVWVGGTRYPVNDMTLYPPEAGATGVWPMPDLAELSVPGLDVPAVVLGAVEPAPFLELPIATYHPASFAGPPDKARTLTVYLRLGAAGEQWQIENHNVTVVGGMSGSPVIDVRSGRVCGMVKASAYASDLPIGGWMIPFSRYSPPGWFEKNRAANPYGNPSRRLIAKTDDFQAGLFQPDEGVSETTPANMLDAESGSAPFEGSAEYRELLAWCHSSDTTIVRLVFGASGSGKTRTAVQICRDLKDGAWVAGFPEPMNEAWFARLGEAVQRELRICVVIDDAEHRLGEIASLLQRFRAILTQLPGTNDPPKTRILLLTRTEPAWFEEEILLTEVPEDRVARWIRKVLASPVNLRPLPLDDQAGAFKRAFQSYADQLGLARTIKPVWPGVNSAATTLDLYAVAADAALSYHFDGAWHMAPRVDPLKAIRDHQLRFWSRRLRNAGYALGQEPSPGRRRTILRRLEPAPVVIPVTTGEAWLLVPTLASATADEHLLRIMEGVGEALGAPGRNEIDTLYQLFPVQPSTAMPATLAPDRLAELMFREVCASLGHVRLQRYLAAVLWLAEGTEPLAGSRTSNPALRLVARSRGASEFTSMQAEEADRQFDQALTALLATYPARLLPELTKLCGALPNAGALVGCLAGAVENCDLELLPTVEVHIHDDGRGLSPLAIAVFGRQMAGTTGMDDASLARRIRWGRSLSLHQEHLRLHAEALRTNENAINECRVLMNRGDPSPAMSEMFARLHGDRALLLLRRNDIEDAMANGEVAIREYGLLGEQYDRSRADASHNQGILYCKRGRLLQALEAGNEAIRLYGEMAPRRSRAAAQLKVSDYLGDLGRPAEALTAASAGLTLMEALFSEAASSHSADYMRAQFQYAMAEYGDTELQTGAIRRESLQRACGALETAVWASRFLPVPEPDLLRLVRRLRSIIREELEARGV